MSIAATYYCQNTIPTTYKLKCFSTIRAIQNPLEKIIFYKFRLELILFNFPLCSDRFVNKGLPLLVLGQLLLLWLCATLFHF